MTKIETLKSPSTTFLKVTEFVQTVEYKDIPKSVSRTAALLILDLIGVLAAARKLDAAIIARDFAAQNFAAGHGAPIARLPFDGREVSLVGYGFAAATQIDNLDAHDGWQPSKGHAGAALFPALCAFAEAQNVSGQEALVAMVIGYEVGYRAAAALHGTVEDYHTSGAWNSLGCAAIGVRLRQSNQSIFRDALGIAEYHSPRSQMMREIANPTMLHDGTGWGAPVGIYAALIAEAGFTGAPAATVEFQDAEFAWKDLGENWLTEQQYIKPYPICRWAHAAIDAALDLRTLHDIAPNDIDQIDIYTFVYSAELNNEVPNTSPLAQYSLAWPVAAALVRGKVGVDEVIESSFSDPDLVSMTGRVKVHIDPVCEQGYPERRLARVNITLKGGQVFESGLVEASGGPDPQPSEKEIIQKFRAFAGSTLSEERVTDIEKTVLSLGDADTNFKDLLELLVAP